MKKLIVLLCIILFFFSCSPVVADPNLILSNNVLAPATISAGSILAGILGIYEIIVRAIPTVANISVVHAAITWLQKISTFFNVSK